MEEVRLLRLLLAPAVVDEDVEDVEEELFVAAADDPKNGFAPERRPKWESKSV